MLCRKCGAQLDDNAQECKFCGEKFEQEAPTEAPDMEATQEIVTPEPRSTHEIFEENAKKRRAQTEKLVDEKKQQLDEINERRELKKKREKRNRIVLIVALCIIVAAAAGFGAYYFRTQDTDIITPTPTPQSTVRPTLAPSNSPVPTEIVPTQSPAVNPSATQRVSNNTSNTGSSKTANAPVKVTPRPTQGAASSSNTAATATITAPKGGSIAGTKSTSYVTPSKGSGVSTIEIKSELVIGGHIITENNKNFMTFEMGGKTYYANVSAGSWTQAINGKYMTVSAVPTEEVYNGNTIYEISKITYYDGEDYIIADSGVKMLTDSDLKSMSKSQLSLARNEIYARHGRTFKTKEFKDYFEKKSWYKINENYNYEDESANLNEIEIKNVDILLKAETSK